MGKDRTNKLNYSIYNMYFKEHENWSIYMKDIYLDKLLQQKCKISMSVNTECVW